MNTYDTIASEIISKLEHGDEEHRTWLRVKGTPLISKALQEQYEEGLMLRDEVHENQTMFQRGKIQELEALLAKLRITRDTLRDMIVGEK